jgi:hypothetical protein
MTILFVIASEAKQSGWAKPLIAPFWRFLRERFIFGREGLG